MKTLRKSLYGISVLALLLALLSLTVSTAAQDEVEQSLIVIASQSEEFAGWLAEYEGWQGYAYPPEEGTVWYVEFYDAAGEEWLGYANVDVETGEIQDLFVPRPLPAEEYAAGKERILDLVFADPEVQVWLIDPLLWDPYVDFNRFEQVWEVHLYRGNDGILIKASLDEYSLYINEIIDENHLSEEQALQDARDQAISLAYSGAGIDQALAGYDDWRTYVENLGGPRWSVTFVANEQELFYALVDIASGKVLETSTGA